MGRWCRKCEGPLKAEHEFCPGCGARVLKEEVPPPGGDVCPRCEADVPAGARICPTCGTHPLRVLVLRDCPRCRVPWKYGRPPTRIWDILAVGMAGGLATVIGLWLAPRWGMDISFAGVVAPAGIVILLALLVNWTSPRTHYCPRCGRRGRISRDLTLAGAMALLVAFIIVWVIWVLTNT